MPAPSFESASSWRQPEPTPASSRRSNLVLSLAQHIDSLGTHRLRIAVDGFTAAGKTSFGHELASALRVLGRPTLRASLDDFKRPWSEAHLYDRVSGEGYYRNAQDLDAVRRLLLDPAGPDGTGTVTLCSIDPITQVNQQRVTVEAPANAVLIVDGVFAMRPEYTAYWDLRIWLDIGLQDSIERGTARDTDMEGREEAERLHRDRYGASEQIYIAEVDPIALADVVIDNRDFAVPAIMKW